MVGDLFVSSPVRFQALDFSSQRFNFAVSRIPHVGVVGGVLFISFVLSGTIFSKWWVVFSGALRVALPDVLPGVPFSQYSFVYGYFQVGSRASLDRSSIVVMACPTVYDRQYTLVMFLIPIKIVIIIDIPLVVLSGTIRSFLPSVFSPRSFL